MLVRYTLAMKKPLVRKSFALGFGRTLVYGFITFGLILITGVNFLNYALSCDITGPCPDQSVIDSRRMWFFVSIIATFAWFGLVLAMKVRRHVDAKTQKNVE